MNASSVISQGGTAPMHRLPFADLAITVETRADGVMIVAPRDQLGDYHTRMSDPLLHWANERPDAIFMAERDASGGWRSVTYRETLARVQALGSAILARGLSAERPVLILSGNAIDHALLMIAGYYVGVPTCSLTTAYSLVSKDYGKLKHTLALLTPGLVYADDAAAYGAAITASVPDEVEVVIGSGEIKGRATTTYADLLATPHHPQLEAIRQSVGPDTIAKFLMTSGSTGMPKAVINTHRMLCSNQVMLLDTLCFIKERTPVIVDWLPWNHTFGGNHNIGLILVNGGSFYIDDGKPMPGAIEATVRNLREISPTILFNVPKGYEMLLPYLKADPVLRKSLFARLQSLFFAGAALSHHIWQTLDDIAIAETGARYPMLTGLGATETAPFALSVLPHTSRSGHVGLPVPGNEIKLVPVDGKLEVRVKGPNVTPGYWRAPDLTAKSFDEEGYYKFGDALRPVDPDDFSKGFDFDGRISEDFKLGSGTWVSVGPLRAKLTAACAPYVRDVVLAGINRDDLAAILIPDIIACRQAAGLAADASMGEVLASPVIVEAIRTQLRAMEKTATGSSTRIPRAAFLADNLSIDKGEVTDKGSINQRAVLDHRTGLVDDLYAAAPPPHVITL